MNAPVRWFGRLEGCHRGLVYGWALDSQRPDARVVLEVCLNEEALRSVIADVMRSDLAETFARLVPEAPDACHGFVADLGVDTSSLSGALSVRVANTGHILDGAAHIEALPPAPVAATSKVTGNSGLRVHGWAVDARDPRRTVTVSAYTGSRKLAEAKADKFVPGMRSSTMGGHGFALDLPLWLGDGQCRDIRVVDEAGMPLNGSPVAVCTFAEGLLPLLSDADCPILGEAIRSYERSLPRGVGLTRYGEWAHRFGAPSPAPQALSVSMIVTGQCEAAALEATLDSIGAQQDINVRIHAPDSRHATFESLVRAAMASGSDVIGCVRCGDTLAPGALALALSGFSDEETQLVYTDSEFQGRPWFKPAWNRDYAYATDYPLELMLVRATLARPAPGAAAFAWAALAAAAGRSAGAIVHIPYVLYQFNSALTAEECSERHAACRSALRKLEPQVTLVDAELRTPLFQARRALRPLSTAERSLKVSLLIPTRDQPAMLARCLESIAVNTDWPNLEIIVIDNGSVEDATAALFAQLRARRVRILHMPGPFNYADLNNRAVEQATGEIVALLNNDIEALHTGWLDEMVAQLLRPGVGAVGAKLLWPNGMVQHGGILMGVGHAAGHFGNYLADADSGDHGRNQLVQQLSGVTAACLLVRRSAYLAAGGMDAHAFPVAFNDVDLCLKLRAAGKLITWTPHARLLHAESASRGSEDSPQKVARARRELDCLRMRWGSTLVRDPAYHPSLSLDTQSSPFGALAIPPRDRTPRTSVVPAPAHLATRGTER